jgi:hypothetical protein
MLLRPRLALTAGVLFSLLASGPCPVAGEGAAVHPVWTPWGEAVGGSTPGSQVTFRLRPVPEELSSRYSSRQIRLLEKLNRVDAERLPRLDSMVVPDRWDADEAEYSPLPRQVQELAEHGKALVVHQPLQVFGAYEGGRLVRWGPVSTGRREHPTPAGRFYLTWKSRGRYSTVNPEWYLPWYFNFHNERGLSFHQYALPGEPASHACVRLLERDARWIFEWGEGWTLDERGWEVLEEGTPVWILGEYGYDRPPPWLRPDDPHPEARVVIEGP